MPYLALADGVSNKPCAKAWIAARSDYDLKADPSLPVILRDRSFGQHAMSSARATELLHDCLTKVSHPPLDSQKLSSHSLKTTLLA
eukprot:5482013-Amphidinium_carterae.1